MASQLQEDIKEWVMDEDRFVSLLEKLVNESKHLQNQPPNLIPQEEKAAAHVLAALAPHTQQNGGPLDVRTIAYAAGRPHVLITYPSTVPSSSPLRVVSFVGSHMDVVPADPATWQRDPFTFSREGDTLYGRGTTDCLGHVALLTELFIQLATKRPPLAVSVFGVLIVDEVFRLLPLSLPPSLPLLLLLLLLLPLLA
jgi:acetylornithine deacetylase